MIWWRGEIMQDMKEFIKNRVNECIQCSFEWEEKVKLLTLQMKDTESEEDIVELNVQRQQYIGKQNELLAVADFGNELLQQYFN